MGPEVAALLGVGGTALVLVLALGLVWWGSSSRQPEVDSLKAEVSRLRLSNDLLKERAAARSAGARADLERAAARADAHARGDGERLLQRFPNAPGAVASESGDEADEAGGRGDDKA